ncbi:lysozyme inhibitor LprI family protein [Saccharibacillus kuerlensis]|uniref:Lysozyme inhibitor LprI-like N-terminal domain-containing protein n=1 Tax=Saccharibacillus kuerlensis TaxID=459527 RepID=A0ABQ2L5T2_9BACL|nr:lysozyme inhibitor LprI family protein [Saccharibacillus kuerlensis]GGO00957.1 hypothetical protein GCM10010969_22730 [Saccharibacillus kuerlensis]
MNKKLLFYRLCTLVVLILAVCTCIIITEKLNSNAKQINALQSSLAEHQKIEKELNVVNTSLQESLNKAHETTNTLEKQIEESNHYGDYQGNKDFSDIINDNPIDKDYERELEKLQESAQSTTLEWGALQTKYITKWQNEMDAALDHLYKSLDEEDRMNLEQAQKSWHSYIEDNSNFVGDRFVYAGHFGTQGKVHLAAVELKRTRERAIELMEYIFSVDRTAVNFVYEDQK